MITVRKSILFICPDYHCTFFYRDELRKLGWKADILVGNSYPEKLLYSEDGIIRVPGLAGGGPMARIGNALLNRLYFFSIFWFYQFLFIYDEIDQLHCGERFLGLTRIFGKSFRVSLLLAKLLGKKIIFMPAGCNGEESKASFSKLDEGEVCRNCGWGPETCDDERNHDRFRLCRKYVDLVVGNGSLDSSQFKTTHFKYKAIDLNLWRPDLEIPPEFRLKPTENLRILHSFYNLNREHDGRNIKGSPHILRAIERLRQEGHKVEYMFINNVPSRNMRYYQAQADIVVDQLIYGWWGSTLVETTALGKPVICYLRPAWKQFFLQTFPEYSGLPVIEADRASIYDVLKNLVVDAHYRQAAGVKSRRFAEQHFDVSQNARGLISLLKGL